MKFKVKISAMDLGRVVKFTHTFDTPDFVEKHHTFLGRDMTETIVEQQNDWLDDNYHLVVDECEKRDLYPIIGYEVVTPTKKKISKKQEVMSVLEKLDMSDELLGIILGTLATLWPKIKQMTVENILDIVFKSSNVSLKVTNHHLTDLSSRLSDIRNRTSTKKLD